MAIGHALKQGIFVVAAKRTPFGAYGGSLKKHSPTDLQVVACNAALKAGNISPEIIDSVVIGNVLSPAAVDAAYVSRHTSLICNLRIEVPANTVNRLCGSGFQAIISGLHEIQVGDAGIVMTGGTDNMSACPYAVRDIRFGTKLGGELKFEDMMWEALTDNFIKTPMGITAENLAEKYKLTREEVDQFALRSQLKWGEAHQKGDFSEEMAPVEIASKKGSKIMDTDEHPRPQTTLEQLSKLPPVFKKGGVVTAGSSSGICDGAGSVIIASEEAVKSHGLRPLARIAAYAVTGCDPKIMGIGPVPSIQLVCKATGISLDDIEEVEINEAFGAQTLACQKELGLEMEKLNTNGGALALGHPLAASGSRISAHLVHKIRRVGAKHGIGAACIGGGQGIAILFERV